MKIANVLGAAAMCVSLTGCYTAQISEYCRQNPIACVAVSAVAAGGIIFLASALLRSNQHAIHHPYPSDRRLKEDVQHIRTLPQGVRVYSFRYLGDDRTFVGLMAQELLADARFRDVVTTDANGFYAVDYEALGLELFGAEEMRQAGANASALAAAS